jgi:predicted PurR-regulated permease PerM
MTRQAHNQLGRILNPFKTVFFISALLLFVITVVYRMVKSASFSNAVATLVESLLIVFFFIFLGILLSYLLYFIYQRFRQGSRRPQAYDMFDFQSDHQKPAGKPDPGTEEFGSDDKMESSPDSA